MHTVARTNVIPGIPHPINLHRGVGFLYSWSEGEADNHFTQCGRPQQTLRRTTCEPVYRELMFRGPSHGFKHVVMEGKMKPKSGVSCVVSSTQV